jgi:galactose-1-phosphate uridylyltransferase
LRTEEDHRLKLADKKKEGIREQIVMLKNQFSKLYEKNISKEKYIQVQEDDFNIDPVFF